MVQYLQERLASYEERDNTIVELFELGLTLKQIGECVGVVPGAVYYVLQKKGLR
jgi:DNA-directed RNA polymerase specialized sigma subunit